MPIVPNPLPLKVPREVGRDRTVSARLWDALTDCVSVLRALLSGRIVEWHEDEPLGSTGATIFHNLKRRPFGRIIVRQSGNRVVYDDYDQWDEVAVVLRTGAGTITVSFVLF